MYKRFSLTILLCILLTGCSGNKYSENITRISDKKITTENQLQYESKSLLNKGTKNFQSGNIDGAIADFQDLTRLYPKLAIAHYNLGLSYAKKNMIKEAIKSWEEVISLDKNYADAYFNLGLIYKKDHNNKKAVENLTRYILLSPDDPNIDSIKDEITKLREPVIGKDIIGRISITDEVDFEHNIALNSKKFFRSNVPFVYACVEVINAAKNTDIGTYWYYKDDNQEILVNSLKFDVEGSKNLLLLLKKPEINWPIGQYKLEIRVNGKKNTVVPYYIQ